MRIDDLVAATAQLTAGGAAMLEERPDLAATITRELATRSDCTPAGTAWWVRALSGPVERDFTMAQLAQEAGVLRARLYAGTLTPSECLVVAQVLTLERDRLWGAIVASVHASARLLDRLGRDPAGLLAVSERAAEPIVIAPPAVVQMATGATAQELAERGPAAVSPAPAAAVRGRLVQCTGCQHLWRTRVERPVKCPRCQSLLAWPEDEESSPEPPVSVATGV